MRQHIIAGRLGLDDIPALSPENNEVATFFDLVLSKKRLGYGIGRALDELIRIGIFPSEIGLDLLILAFHIYGADTRISRKTEAQDTWTREIHLVVPVSDPDRWTAVKPLLKRMLDFLTGDRWSFDFRHRPRDFSTLIPAHFSHWESPKYKESALFSGGLDSLIGAIDALESGICPLLISHAGEGATRHAQDVCFEYLHNHYENSSLSHLRVWTKFPDGFVKDVASESTTRSRSFLFFAIGVFAGTGLDGTFTLLAPENGLIAINAPLDPLRLGSLSTRTMHPFYLARWNDLLDNLEIPGSIKNPYWNKTKGEMMMKCTNPGLLRQITPFSLSCSSPTKGRWQGHGIEHCGHCLPCLIRRAAIKKAFGPREDPTKYTLSDLKKRTLDTNRVEGQQVRSLQFVIERLRAKPSLAKLLIHKPGSLSDLSSDDLQALADVYRRGMNEVALLLANVRT